MQMHTDMHTRVRFLHGYRYLGTRVPGCIPWVGMRICIPSRYELLKDPGTDTRYPGMHMHTCMHMHTAEPAPVCIPVCIPRVGTYQYVVWTYRYAYNCTQVGPSCVRLYILYQDTYWWLYPGTRVPVGT